MLCNLQTFYLFQMYFSKCHLDTANTVSCSSTSLACLGFSESKPNFVFHHDQARLHTSGRKGGISSINMKLKYSEHVLFIAHA